LLGQAWAEPPYTGNPWVIIRLYTTKLITGVGHLRLIDCYGFLMDTRDDAKRRRAVTRHRNLVAKDSPYKPKQMKTKKSYVRPKKYSHFDEEFPS